MGKFVMRKTNTGVKFDLKAGNGEVIATSEVYSSDAACKNGIESVKKNSAVAAVEDQTVEGYATEKNPKFEVYADKAGEFRFRLTATNGQTIAVSEAYKAKASCSMGDSSVGRYFFRIFSISACSLAEYVYSKDFSSFSLLFSVVFSKSTCFILIPACASNARSTQY